MYVDGYLAGRVDDYDGVFQRLRVAPGGHEIVVYRDGFHAFQQHLYLAPGSDQHMKFALQPLAPGEAPDPRPVPQPRRGGESSDEDQPLPRYGRGGGPPQARPDQGPPAPPGGVEPPANPPQPDVRVDPRSFGTLSLVVKPADAEILIDGTPWGAPSGESKIVIKLSEGRHHLEIQKDGYSRYVEDIGIMRGRTLSLNVSLVK